MDAADTPAFCGWESEPALPEARSYHTVVTTDNYIYVLCGYRFDATTSHVIYYNGVMRSMIRADGHLSPWTAEESFNSARSGSAGVKVGKCIFLSGGTSSIGT